MGELISNIFKSADINYVVHFAAESHVDRSIKEPEIFVKTNILCTVNMLNCVKNSWETKDGFRKQLRKALSKARRRIETSFSQLLNNLTLTES